MIGNHETKSPTATDEPPWDGAPVAAAARWVGDAVIEDAPLGAVTAEAPLLDAHAFFSSTRTPATLSASDPSDEFDERATAAGVFAHVDGEANLFALAPDDPHPAPVSVRFPAAPADATLTERARETVATIANAALSPAAALDQWTRALCGRLPRKTSTESDGRNRMVLVLGIGGLLTGIVLVLAIALISGGNRPAPRHVPRPAITPAHSPVSRPAPQAPATIASPSPVPVPPTIVRHRQAPAHHRRQPTKRAPRRAHRVRHVATPAPARTPAPAPTPAPAAPARPAASTPIAQSSPQPAPAPAPSPPAQTNSASSGQGPGGGEFGFER